MPPGPGDGSPGGVNPREDLAKSVQKVLVLVLVLEVSASAPPVAASMPADEPFGRSALWHPALAVIMSDKPVLGLRASQLYRRRDEGLLRVRLSLRQKWSE